MPRKIWISMDFMFLLFASKSLHKYVVLKANYRKQSCNLREYFKYLQFRWQICSQQNCLHISSIVERESLVFLAFYLYHSTSAASPVPSLFIYAIPACKFPSKIFHYNLLSQIFFLSHSFSQCIYKAHLTIIFHWFSLVLLLDFWFFWGFFGYNLGH